MYFASNWDNTGGAPWDSLAIWRWHEDSNNLSSWTRAVPAWTGSGPGSIHCGTPNWLGHADQRLLNGAIYQINNDGIAEPRQTGRKIVGWWWNVAEGGGFTYPYVEGAAFYEDTMTLLPGFLGRPYIFGSWCFAYPSFTPNKRGDLGGVFNYADSPNYHLPKVAYSIADDYWQAPPGGMFNSPLRVPQVHQMLFGETSIPRVSIWNDMVRWNSLYSRCKQLRELLSSVLVCLWA
jgi:hypothetical protein